MVFSTTCGTTKVSYTALDPSLSTATCTPIVLVEIPISSIQVTTATDITKALEEGYDLKWIGNYADCQRCIGAGGVCGNDGNTGFRFFCQDGAYATTCDDSEKALSSSMSFNFNTIHSYKFVSTNNNRF